VRARFVFENKKCRQLQTGGISPQKLFQIRHQGQFQANGKRSR
jgi:hypothetical protein